MTEEIDNMFLAEVQESSTLVNKRANVRPVGADEIVVTATIESFVHTLKPAGNNGEKPETCERGYPPVFAMATTKDKKKQYPAPMVIYGTLTDASLVEHHSRRLPDGTLQVLVKCNYFEDTTTWLNSLYQRAWSPGPAENDPSMKKVREYINSEGVRTEHKWKTVTVGDRYKFKVSGKEEKEKNKEETNLFRKTINGGKNFFIQPGATVRFFKINPEIWIALRNKDTAADAETEGEELAEASGGKFVVEYFAFQCKGGAAVTEDYDPTLEYTERLHQSKNADAHQMVCVRDFERNTKLCPRTAYFYVARQYITKWSPDTVHEQRQGVAIVREAPEIKDFIHEYQGNKSVSCALRFSVYQWQGKPNRDNRFIVKVITKKESPLWRKFGINNPEAYACIMAGNPQVPVHVTANIWPTAIFAHESNKPEIINNVPELENVRGYYIYSASDLTPDFLRFFKQQGMRLSADFVKTEFADWENENKKLKISTITLKPLDSTKANPLNERGISSNVLALGNGFQTTEQANLDPTVGINHAYDGSINDLFKGEHDFYFLQSKPIATIAEASEYAGTGKEADELLKRLKQEFDVHYWIYAVRKDAKLATPTAGAYAPAVGVKRERPAETVVESEDVSELKKAQTTDA